jgi:exocyst complex component 1
LEANYGQTLNDDIAYIEAQSQGLQVQTANQKLLQTELQNLLETLSISPSQLQPLKEGSLGSPDGVERIEKSLSMLYQAMVKIDPTIQHERSRPSGEGKDTKGRLGGPADKEISAMRAVREKKDIYQSESLLFVQRLRQYMSKAFQTAAKRTVESIERSNRQLRPQNYKLDPTIHNGARQEIWMYGPLMLFTRDIDPTEWGGMVRSYEQSIKVAYQDEFRDNVAAWTKSARKPMGEEQDVLFTGQEKEPEGITTAARKLTVKRGKTVRVAGSLRQTISDKQDGKMEPFEAFSGALEEMTTLIFEEQNFVTSFFHATSHSNAGFTDAIASARPQFRTLPKLSSKQTFDPDRDMAKRVSQVMEDIFPSWTTDVQNMVEWTLKPDRL